MFWRLLPGLATSRQRPASTSGQVRQAPGRAQVAADLGAIEAIQSLTGNSVATQLVDAGTAWAGDRVRLQGSFSSLALFSPSFLQPLCLLPSWCCGPWAPVPYKPPGTAPRGLPGSASCSRTSWVAPT